MVPMKKMDTSTQIMAKAPMAMPAYDAIFNGDSFCRSFGGYSFCMYSITLISLSWSRWALVS
jgi:hypothetical protein